MNLHDNGQAVALCDSHGTALYLLANMINGQSDYSVDAVAEALRLASEKHEGPSTGKAPLRELARLTYEACTRPGRERSWQATVSAQQQAALGLCLYGGHTFREAATLLDLPSRTVAGILRAGLSEVAARLDESRQPAGRGL